MQSNLGIKRIKAERHSSQKETKVTKLHRHSKRGLFKGVNELNLVIEIKKDYTHVRIHGDLDSLDSAELKERIYTLLRNPAVVNLILELEDVQYINSINLGTLIGIKRRTAEKGGKAILVLHSDRVDKLFELTGLKRVFTTTRNKEDAEEAITE